MSGFKMDDYVDVAERIREFSAKYPDGSLQSTLEWHEHESEVWDNNARNAVRVKTAGWLCRAFAYRDREDLQPGIGHAFEPVPGKTPYTKDSEAMNAETSAWGRAIVALGFNTKKIASAQEVQARQAADGQTTRGESDRPQKPNGFEESNGANIPAGQVVLSFGKHKGSMVKDAPRQYLEWWVGQPEPNTEPLRKQRAAVQEFLALDGVPAGVLVEDDIPF